MVVYLQFVIAGQKREARLGPNVPAIHVFLRWRLDVDARHKAGHDGKCEIRAEC